MPWNNLPLPISRLLRTSKCYIQSFKLRLQRLKPIPIEGRPPFGIRNFKKRPLIKGRPSSGQGTSLDRGGCPSIGWYMWFPYSIASIAICLSNCNFQIWLLQLPFVCRTQWINWILQRLPDLILSEWAQLIRAAYQFKFGSNKQGGSLFRKSK